MATLFNKETLLHALLREAPDVAGSTIGAGFRLSMTLRESTPLAFLVAKKPELAWPAIYFLNDYERYWRLGGTAVDRARVREGAEVLMEQVKLVLYGEERAAALRMLESRHRLLNMGEEALDALAAAERVAPAGRRAGQNAARRLARTRTLTSEAVAEQVQRLWLSLPKPKRTRALHMFFETLPLSNTRAWEGIFDRLISFKGLAAKMDQVRAGKKIIDAFRHDANNLKGLLLEISFWHGPTWARWEKPLLDQAARRARQLSAGGGRYKAVLIAGPLRVIGSGQELYDGAILLVRSHPTEPMLEEAVLHAAIQMKAEKKLTVMKQIPKDMRRESEKVLLGLRTQAGDREFILAAAPDAQEAKRIIVVPKLPTAGRMAQAPLGAEIIAAPTLLDADDFDEVAAFLFEAAAQAEEVAKAAK